MSRKSVFTLLAAGMFAALFALDQVRSTEPFDLIAFFGDMLETALLATAICLTMFVSLETRDLRSERRALIGDLDAARKESGHWRATARAHVAGLSHAIATQFAGWGLTEAEADVAGLMLKGLSHKEIASLRDCAEATVRQHATTVYRKSGLANRAQLTAFFLEDLLAPAAARGPDLRLVKDL
jgi:DNA-binding CsgD family transcriptional regulator